MGGCPVTALRTAIGGLTSAPTRVLEFGVDAGRRLLSPRNVNHADPEVVRGVAELRGPVRAAAPGPGAVTSALQHGQSGADLVSSVRGDLTDADWRAVGTLASVPPLGPRPESLLGRVGHALDRLVQPIRTEFVERPNPRRLDAAHAGELRARVHGALGTVFGPMADDLLRQLRELDGVSLDALPRSGAPPEVSAYEHGLHNTAVFRSDVAGGSELFEKAHQRLSSQQTIPGAARMHELDVTVPIGDYGEPMARALVEAARVMDAVALERMGPHATAFDDEFGRVLGDWTFRRDTLPTLLEGNGTFAGMTAVWTHHRVPGMSGSDMLRAVEEGHLLERAAKGPLGLAGPMFFRGFVPKRSVIEQGGRLRPSPEYASIERLTRERKAGALIRPSQVRATQRGCPIAVRNIATPGATAAVGPRETYIGALGREYLRLARAFYEREVGP